MRITKADAAAELEIDIDACEDEIRSAYKVFPIEFLHALFHLLHVPFLSFDNFVNFYPAAKSCAMAPR